MSVAISGVSLVWSRMSLCSSGLVSDLIVIQREDVRPHSRGAMRPSFASIGTLDKNKRAQGKPGARCTRGLVCKIVRKGAHEHTGSAETLRHPPRNGFTAYGALSPASRALLPPSSLRILFPRNLTPASGRQDHTASPSATAAFVIRRHRVHRIPPRVRDDREPPLSSGETGGAIEMICPTG